MTTTNAVPRLTHQPLEQLERWNSCFSFASSDVIGRAQYEVIKMTVIRSSRQCFRIAQIWHRTNTLVNNMGSENPGSEGGA